MTIETDLNSVAELAGLKVRCASPLSTESRNSLWRLALDGTPGSAVLKVYDPATDAHAANRCRREEKVLALLSPIEPRICPAVLASVVRPTGSCMLLMEDAGKSRLADALTSGRATWADAAEFVVTLHAAMEARRLPLYRTAMAISLDRITGPVLAARFRVAGRRILGREAPPTVVRPWSALMAPLLRAPKAMIHNSLSPLNIVTDGERWRAVDWETLTWASPLWDWAELLRSPYDPPSMEECAEIAKGATGGDRLLFYRAVLSRALDALATVTLRYRRYRDDGLSERAEEYRRRAGCYMDDIRAVLPEIDPPAPLARWLEGLMGGVE